MWAPWNSLSSVLSPYSRLRANELRVDALRFAAVYGRLRPGRRRLFQQATPQGRQGTLVDRISEELLPGYSHRVPAAVVPGRAFQDSDRFDGADIACRRFHSGEQVRLRHPAASGEQED